VAQQGQVRVLERRARGAHVGVGLAVGQAGKAVELGAAHAAAAVAASEIQHLAAGRLAQKARDHALEPDQLESRPHRVMPLFGVGRGSRCRGMHASAP
jgi:hypothetical protein